MGFSGSRIKKNFYISGNGNPKKSLLIFWEIKTLKNFYISRNATLRPKLEKQKESTLKETPYISGHETF